MNLQTSGVLNNPGEQSRTAESVCRQNSHPLLALNPGGGHSLVSSVPMRDQKNDEKGYFFSRRAVRSADII